MKSSSSSSLSSHRHRVVVVTAATGRRRRTQSRRRPGPRTNDAHTDVISRCPFCGANAPSKSHLAICAPDALNPRGWSSADACESAAVRESVLRRHGRRSRAYEVCSARFGWDDEEEDGGRVRVRSAKETRDAWRGGRGKDDDDEGDDGALLKLVVDIVRREVRATPLSVEAVTTETLEILRDDVEATFVNKPARTPCTPTSRLSGDASVTAMVLAWWGEEAAKRATTGKAKEIAKSLRRTPYAAHRLDLETSGVFVLCKTAAAAKKAQRAFESGTTTKVYLAVCRISSSSLSPSLSPPLSSSSKCWTLIDYPLVKEQEQDPADGSSSFRVRAVRERRDDQQGKSAQTFVRVLAKTSTHALVQARPRTGRTHQIRAHLAAVGLPIVCDALYDDEDDEDSYTTTTTTTTISRHALHAHALKFPDDDDVVIADPPSDFVACLRELGLFVVVVAGDDGDSGLNDDDTDLMKAFLRQSSLEAVRILDQDQNRHRNGE